MSLTVAVKAHLTPLCIALRARFADMPVFQVTPLSSNTDRLREAIDTALPPENHYELPGTSGWLVNFNGTSVELSNVIGVTGQPTGQSSSIGPTIITHVVSYYGRGPTDMWEWLKLRFEASE